MVQEESISILVVEDNRDIAESIYTFLDGKRYQVDVICSGIAALTLLEANAYDVIVMDVMLPGLDGFTLAIKLRNTINSSTPILFLTSSDIMSDKLEGFTFGGDDYMTKPFALEELDMRIKVLATRSGVNTLQLLKVGEWRLDERRYEIRYRDDVIKVTKIGFKIFKSLMSSYPNVLTRRDLEKVLWGDTPPDSDSIRSHIFTLRKVTSAVCNSSVIETVHGVGFRLQVDEELPRVGVQPMYSNPSVHVQSQSKLAEGIR